MVAMLAFGGTYAYFTATTSSKTTNATTGAIRLQLGDVTTVTDAIVTYGEPVLGAVTFGASETTAASYVFATLSSTITPNADDTAKAVTFNDLFGATLTPKTGWTKLKDLDNGAGTVYYYVLAEGATDLSLEFVDGLTVSASPNWAEGTDTMPLTMGVGVSVSVSGVAIQQAGFKTESNTDADAAALAYVEAVKVSNIHADK